MEKYADRKTVRLGNYAYDQAGAYFLTICTKDRKCILADIVVGTPVPTKQNNRISRFASTWKRFCNKACGESIWQSRSYDHVIRDRDDYESVAEYIHNNPQRWLFDELYQK